MKIHISNKKKIAALQEEFNHAFPFLRLEFFSKPHYAYDGNSRKYLISDYETIGDFNKIDKSSSISISPGMKVEELEKIFQDIFGLFVHVFRQSGKVWLETTMTDDWTLDEQNKQGEELSKHRQEKEKPFPAEDYGDLE
jgi:hypothetical protein